MSFTPSNTMTQRTLLCPSTSRLKRLDAVGPRPPLVMVLPPMPWFKIATLVLPAELRRLAKSSGQRLLPLVVEPRPSVIESPSATTALASVMVSRPERMYQWSVVSAEDMLAALTLLLADCR